MLKGIIFDLDGVIVASHPAHKQAWRELLASLGREVSEAQLEFVVEGHKRDEILQHFLGDLSGEEVRRLGQLKDDFYRRVAHQVKLIPGVEDFISAAKLAGLALAVATSAGRRRAEETLRRFELMESFRVVVTGDEVQAGKPDPAVFQRAADGLELGAEHLLVCEDAVAGVQAAKRAGMRCLGIAGNGRSEVLRNAGADWVVRDFIAISVGDVQGLFLDQMSKSTANV
ncbi:MAG TPA: HAD family phosphatase [Candidatus Angelobacter sp.]|nr:HAD family phosphatase [Candidatus Angelobacter sp.]